MLSIKVVINRSVNYNKSVTFLMQYQRQRMKSCMAKKKRSDKFLTIKSDNILTAWKFLSLFYQFTGNVNLFNWCNYYRKENRTATNNKLVKSTEDITYNDKKLTTCINSVVNLNI